MPVKDRRFGEICQCGAGILPCDCPAAVCYGWVHDRPDGLHACMATPGDGRGAYPRDALTGNRKEKDDDD